MKSRAIERELIKIKKKEDQILNSADTSLFGINRFPGKHGSDLPKDQLLRLHYYSYPLVLPPSFETILSNAGRDLKVRMITYLL